MGKEIRELSPKEIYRKVGLIFQNSDEQLFAPTVFEDVAFGPTNMGFTGEEVALRVTRGLKDVDMEGYGKSIDSPSELRRKEEDLPCGLLSHVGQEILLLDEPTVRIGSDGRIQDDDSFLMRLNKEQGNHHC